MANIVLIAYCQHDVWYSLSWTEQRSHRGSHQPLVMDRTESPQGRHRPLVMDRTAGPKGEPPATCHGQNRDSTGGCTGHLSWTEQRAQRGSHQSLVVDRTESPKGSHQPLVMDRTESPQGEVPATYHGQNSWPKGGGSGHLSWTEQRS